MAIFNDITKNNVSLNFYLVHKKLVLAFALQSRILRLNLYLGQKRKITLKHTSDNRLGIDDILQLGRLNQNDIIYINDIVPSYEQLDGCHQSLLIFGPDF